MPVHSATNPKPRAADELSVAVIADSAAARRRFVDTLGSQELHVAAELEAPDQAMDVVDASTVIVFACDIDAPQQMTSLRRLRRATEATGIVVISPPATGTGVRRALDAGADAIVFEPECELALATAVYGVANGQSVVPRNLRASLERPVLSHREGEVLTLVANGLTNAEIANSLFLAESTIKSHISSIFTKFGVRSRKEVAAVLADLDLRSPAVAGNLVDPSPERATR